MAVEGAQVHPPSLVEADGPRVVVGGDEPEAAVSGGYGVVAGRVHKGTPDSPSLLHADDGDHLALAVNRFVGQKTDGTPILGSHKAREDGGVD